MTARSATAMLNGGDLAGAVAAASAVVKAKPVSAPDRVYLAELLALQGQHQRADTHLKLAADGAPAELLAISQMRYLLRAAEARRAWHESGSVPDFIGQPNARQQQCMRLALLVREGDAPGARALLDELEALPLTEASVDGAAPAPLRDASDLDQHGFEMLTLDGRYLWIAPEQVARMQLLPVRRPRDLLWRQAEVSLADGRDVTFFAPAQYHAPAATDAQRLAAETDWSETVGGIVVGQGQRILLVGEDARGFLDIRGIAVAA